MPSSARDAAEAAAAALEAARRRWTQTERRTRRKKKVKSRGPGCFLTAIQLPLADDSQRKLLDVALALVNSALPPDHLVVFPGRTEAAARELTDLRAMPQFSSLRIVTIRDVLQSVEMENVQSIVCCGASLEDAKTLMAGLGDKTALTNLDTIAFVVSPGVGFAPAMETTQWDESWIPFSYVLLPIAASGLSQKDAFLIYDACIENEPAKKPWKVLVNFENPELISASRARPTQKEIEDAMYFFTQKDVASKVSEAVDSSPLSSLANQLSSTVDSLKNKFRSGPG